MAHLQRQFISREEVNTRETLTRTSFWVPQVQPEAASAKLKKVRGWVRTVATPLRDRPSHGDV